MLISKESLLKKFESGALLFEPAVRKIIKDEPEAIVRCKDCRWGREVCENIECFVDSNIPPEYHGYEWFCPNGERRTDATFN